MLRASQSQEELRLTPLIGTRGNPFAPGAANDPAAAKEWQGAWRLNGHLVTLEQLHLPPGKAGNAVYMFGWSNRAKKYFMITVTGGGEGQDAVDVSWFKIAGREWRFDPVGDTVNGKQVVHSVVWDGKAPAASLVAVDTLEPAPQPQPRDEMGMFRAWQGKFPTQNTEANISDQGLIDSKLIANGNFLAWFEKDVLTDPTGKKINTRQVTLWGYSDVRGLYYRLDVGTYVNRPITPAILYSPWFAGQDNGILILTSPLTKKKIGNEMQSTRYLIGMPPGSDTLTIVEQYLFGGVTWTDSPGGLARWGRIK